MDRSAACFQSPCDIPMIYVKCRTRSKSPGRGAMRKIAKLFKTGRSQAVRLPSDFRFSSPEVFIRKDPEPGDVILSRKPGSWDDLFALADIVEIPANSRFTRLPSAQKTPGKKAALSPPWTRSS